MVAPGYIGVRLGQLGPHEPPIILGVAAGGPAVRAGLRSGDSIIDIDGVSTRKLAEHEYTARLKGEPGSQVDLSIRRPDESDALTIHVTRQT